jgi:CBS domain-containing protein
MTSPVLTVSADELVEDVVKRLAFHEIGGMPVEDWDGTIIGMVSQSDVIDKLGVVVRDVMQTALVSVKPGMSIDQVAAVMAENQIKRVPVLDGNRLLGIISRADIVRAMAESVPVAG